MNKVFKPMKKGDCLRSATLYSDGHVVAWFERWIHDTNSRVNYIKVAQSIGVRAAFEGRISFSTPGLLIAIAGMPEASIRTTEASTEHGSDNTRSRGIAVGCITVESGAGYFCISTFPDLISSGYYYTSNDAWTFAQSIANSYWGDHETRIVEVIYDKADKAAA